jgi:hypothetical protein
MMNDDYSVYSDWHKERTKKRKANKEESTEILKEVGVQFRSRNNGVHLMILDGDRTIYDFWPSTGKYIKRSTQRHGRGVFKLIGELKELGVL